MTHHATITIDPQVMGGKACIGNTRVTVSMILNQLGTGRTIDEILDDFPYLDRNTVLVAVRYGAELVRRQSK